MDQTKRRTIWRSLRSAMLAAGSAILLPGATLAANPEPMPRGDLHETHQFAQSGEPAHYRLYIPTNYDPAKAWPLLVVLHGSGSDENSTFDRSTLAQVAEKRGYIVVAPFGSQRGGFGNCYPVVVTRETAAALPKPGSPPKPGAMREPLVDREVPADDYVYQSATELQPDHLVAEHSEQETMAVLGLVREQYHVDAARIYLMGNSMGGLGTAYLAVKYPEIWAAVAPQGGPVAAWAYPFERLRQNHVAALFVHGEYDEHSSPHWSQLLAQSARAVGVDADFLLVPGGHHGDAWSKVLPQTFDFFSRHTKPKAAPIGK